MTYPLPIPQRNFRDLLRDALLDKGGDMDERLPDGTPSQFVTLRRLNPAGGVWRDTQEQAAPPPPPSSPRPGEGERDALVREESDLSEWRNPAPHHSRLSSGVRRAARGFVEGAARTGTLAGGVGGAAGGFAYGAAEPNWIERDARDREL